MINGTSITLCIPVLKRYDCLDALIKSAEECNPKPDKYLIVNNGKYSVGETDKIAVYNPGYNIGVAASWNYFIDHTNDIRIISNDDTLVYEDIFERFYNMVMGGSLFVSPSSISQMNGFSFFCVTDKMIDKVGKFDVEISPNYGYFEDNDYCYRIRLAHSGRDVVDCNIKHSTSATLKAYDTHEMNEHHRRFRVAKDNYVKKWGGEPGFEKFVAPYGR